MSPKVKILLYASLALNVLVIGAVVGALALGPHMGHRGDSQRRAGPERGWSGPSVLGFARGLNPEARRALGRALGQDQRLRDGRANLRAGRAAVVQALQATPFDPGALRTALDAQRAIQADLATHGIETLVAVIAEMSDADRAAFADTVANGRRGQWRRRN